MLVNLFAALTLRQKRNLSHYPVYFFGKGIISQET